MPLRLQQALVLLLGVLATAAMVAAGVWQLDVYAAQGEEAARTRAAAPAVPLREVAPVGGQVGDGYGRSVSVAGSYLADTQLTLPVDGSPDQVRILTALRTEGGQVVAVVRGLAPAGTAPTPPRASVTQVGVLLPSEEAGPTGTAGTTTTVRVPALAQTWPGPLVDGYLTLSPADATAQGLQPAPPPLPEARGRLRNGAYALQWWVFAAFAAGMAIKIARDLAIPDLEPALAPSHGSQDAPRDPIGPPRST